MGEATESVAVRPAEGSIIDTRYWHMLEDGRVQCDVCPRACKLRDGQRGLCFVRGAEAGRIKLFSYGRSSGFCVDPVEKKPLKPGVFAGQPGAWGARRLGVPLAAQAAAPS
jgi:pyruvate formate lyase activating enzyme